MPTTQIEVETKLGVWEKQTVHVRYAGVTESAEAYQKSILEELGQELGRRVRWPAVLNTSDLHANSKTLDRITRGIATISTETTVQDVLKNLATRRDQRRLPARNLLPKR